MKEIRKKITLLSALAVTSFVLFSALSSSLIMTEGTTANLATSPVANSLNYNSSALPSVAQAHIAYEKGPGSTFGSWQSIGNQPLGESPFVESPVAKFTVNFTATNKPSGESWSVYVYTDLALSAPDLPLYNTIYHESNGLIFSSSATSSSISGSIGAGTYYYYAGPSSTLSGPYKLIISGNRSVSVLFPVLHSATFTETGLPPGTIWTVYASSSQSKGNMTILSESSSNNTILASLPDGYYSFAFGTGSTVIESNSFAISGSNIDKQISFPTLYPTVFQESGLTAGSSWQLFGETTSPNAHSLNTFFVDTASQSSITIYLPDGVYYYQPTFERTTFTEPSSIYVSGSSQNVSISFPSLTRFTIDTTGLATGLSWQISVYSSDGTIYAQNSSYNSNLTLEIPSGSFTYTAGEGSSYFLSGDFNVTSTNSSISIALPQTHRVNFLEAGLYGGMDWSVTVYGSGHTTVFSNTTLDHSSTIDLPTGTYSYSVSEGTMGTVLFHQSQYVYSSSTFTLGTSHFNVSISFPELVATTFSETNLGSGILWGVGVYSSTSATGFSEVFYNTSSSYANVTVYLINGSFYYSVEEAGSYFYPSVNTFSVAGIKQIIDYHFSTLYQISFSIDGLKSANTWYLTVDETNYSVIYSNSSSSAVMSAFLPNGSYIYTVTTTSKLTTSNHFSVNGSALSVPISVAVSYSIKFIESGLPSGDLWYVSLNGTYSFSSNSTIQVSEPNGTYPYSVVSSSYVAAPGNGTVTVAGNDLSIALKFTSSQTIYSITFSETGLASGTPWYITISNSTVSSIHGSIVLQEPNGTYSYEINASGFTPTPAAGLLTVNGANQTVPVVFTVSIPVSRYGITFSEIGLTVGTKWSVSLTNSTNSGKVIGTISTSADRIDVYGITYDSSNKYLYASGTFENSSSPTKHAGVVIVISPVTNSIISTINVGSLPETSVYDPYNGYLYTANSLSNNVSVINTATETVIATIPVGDGPVGITYSSTNHYVYVANSASGTVSVINSSANAVFTTITVASSGGTLAGAVFDSSNGNVYVGGFNNASHVDSVYVISTVTNKVIANISGAAYFGTFDSQNGFLYFTDNSLNSVLVVDGSTNKVVTTIDLPTHSSPIGIAYNSYDHNIYVAEQNSSSLAVISTLTNTVIANLDVTGSPLFPTYDPSTHSVYLSNHLVGGIQVISSYGGVSNIQTATGVSIQFSEPNGTYSYSIGSINGYGVEPQSGSLAVNGSSLTQSVAFSAVAGYQVTFSQTGLRAGATWSVTLGPRTQTSTSSTITFTEINGTYSYKISNVSGYVVSQTSGVVMVSGSSITKTITFSELFSINFNASNLASGTIWTVTLNGGKISSNESMITFMEVNGSYSFSVNSTGNYTISPSSGTVTVNGASVNEPVQFSPLQAPIYLTGTITPSNATLYVNGQLVPTVNGTFNVSVQPGSYEIKVSLTGYKTYYDNISVSSNQTHVSALTVTLGKISPTPKLPISEIVIIAAIVVVIIASAVAATMRNREKNRNKKD